MKKGDLTCSECGGWLWRLELELIAVQPEPRASIATRPAANCSGSSTPKYVAYRNRKAYGQHPAQHLKAQFFMTILGSRPDRPSPARR